MKKGLIQSTLCICMIFALNMPVYADCTEYYSDGTHDVEAVFTIEDAVYTISLPALVTLSYDSSLDMYSGKAGYQIKGTLGLSNYVEVTLSDPSDPHFPAAFSMKGTMAGGVIDGQVELIDSFNSSVTHQLFVSKLSTAIMDAISDVPAYMAPSRVNVRELKADFESDGGSPMYNGYFKPNVKKPSIADEYTGTFKVYFSLHDAS